MPNIPRYHSQRRRVLIGSPGFWLFYMLFMYFVYMIYFMYVMLALMARVAVALAITAVWGCHELGSKIQEKRALKV